MSAQLAQALVASLDETALRDLAAALAPFLPAAPTAPEPSGYLTAEAAATYLGVSRKRIYDLKSMRALEPDGYDGRTPLWTQATLDEYVRRGDGR